jgi:uncharacterized membrane protein YgcG
MQKKPACSNRLTRDATRTAAATTGSAASTGVALRIGVASRTGAALRTGAVRTRALFALTLAAGAVSGIAWHYHRLHRFHLLAEKIYHLKDGRFCYRQPGSSGGDTWYWLCNDSGDYYRSPRPLGPRMPGRTAWMSSTDRANLQRNPDEEENEEIAKEQNGNVSGAEEEEVAENSDDEPASVDEGGSAASSDDASSDSDSGGDSGGGDSGGDSSGGGDD